jgi:hypothetical protein
VIGRRIPEDEQWPPHSPTLALCVCSPRYDMACQATTHAVSSSVGGGGSLSWPSWWGWGSWQWRPLLAGTTCAIGGGWGGREEAPGAGGGGNMLSKLQGFFCGVHFRTERVGLIVRCESGFHRPRHRRTIGTMADCLPYPPPSVPSGRRRCGLWRSSTRWRWQCRRRARPSR